MDLSGLMGQFFGNGEMESLTIKLDDEAQVVEIEGIKYSYEFFREFGSNGMPTGQLFRLLQRYKSYVVVERLEEVKVK